MFAKLAQLFNQTQSEVFSLFRMSTDEKLAIVERRATKIILILEEHEPFLMLSSVDTKKKHPKLSIIVGTLSIN